MAEAIYKVGDILEIESQYGMFSSDKKSRCLVLKCIKPGYEFIIYTILVLKSDDSFTVIGVNQKDIICTAKRVGHIDISSFLSDDEESAEPDYAILFAVATIAQVADLKNENEKLKAENKALSDTLSKSEAKAQSRLDKNEVLKRENERLSNENGNLKTMNDELKSSWIDCCTSCKQTEENKKLMDENAKLSLKLHDADEKTRKLEEENGKLTQKISCADKLLAEAANRLYQGRAHLNISAHN